MQRTWIGILATLLVVSLVGNFLMYNRYSTSRPLVIVGSDVISKKTYQDGLDYQAGSTVLKKMVYTSLVIQAATKAGVLPTTQDVEQRITDIRRRSPQSLAAADRDPAKMQDFRDNLRSDLALENLRTKDVKVSDAEVAAFYAANKRAFVLPQQVQTTMVVTDNSVNAQTAVSLLQAGMKDDVIARQPGMHVAGVNEFSVDVDRLNPADKKKISEVVFSMSPGDIRTVPVQGAFLTFRAKKSEAANIPALQTIRPLVVRALKLQKAPSAQLVLASLYQKTKPAFQVDRYEAYFKDIQDYDVKKEAQAEKVAGY